MPAPASESENLGQVIDRVLATRERAVFERDGKPVTAMVSARELKGLDLTVDLLSDPRTVRRIVEAENAIHSGSLFMGEELAVLDPEGRFVARSVAGGAALAAAMRSGGGTRWDLVTGTAARDSLDALQLHVADAVRRFVFGPMLNDPAVAGVELRGFLSRRFAARIETTLVVYRLDSVKRVVRLIEVLNMGGSVGDHESAARRW